MKKIIFLLSVLMTVGATHAKLQARSRPDCQVIPVCIKSFSDINEEQYFFPQQLEKAGLGEPVFSSQELLDSTTI